MTIDYIADSIVKGSYIAQWFIYAGVGSYFLFRFKPTRKLINKYLLIRD